MDFSGYQPHPQVLEKLKGVDFVAVVGPTAVGKTTLMMQAAANRQNMHVIATQTSRMPRKGEIDGLGIRFRPKQEMLDRIAKNQFVQVAPSLLGDIYATGPEDYPEEGVAMMAVLASALDTFRGLPFRSFRVIFVVPPSWEEWQVRIRSHGFEPHRLVKRLQEAKNSFLFALHSPQVTLVINDALAKATQDFTAVTSGEQLSLRLAADQQKGREIITAIVARL